jgi:hypothetical protein
MPGQQGGCNTPARSSGGTPGWPPCELGHWASPTGAQEQRGSYQQQWWWWWWWCPHWEPPSHPAPHELFGVPPHCNAAGPPRPWGARSGRGSEGRVPFTLLWWWRRQRGGWLFLLHNLRNSLPHNCPAEGKCCAGQRGKQEHLQWPGGVLPHCLPPCLPLPHPLLPLPNSLLPLPHLPHLLPSSSLPHLPHPPNLCAHALLHHACPGGCRTRRHAVRCPIPPGLPPRR